VGCAAGSVAQYLGGQKNCRVVGIERDPLLARKARAHCERVVVGDVESGNLLSKVKGAFGAIIFADVLEHLRSPEAVLAAAKTLLEPDGEVFVSVPNVANWRVRLRLLLGRFEYKDTGILDRTHLRFFTRHTAVKLIHSCGYQVVGMKTTSGRGKFIPTLLSALAPGWFAYQFIFKAVPCRSRR